MPPTTTIANTRPATTNRKREMAIGRALGWAVARDRVEAIIGEAPLCARRAERQARFFSACYIVSADRYAYSGAMARRFTSVSRLDRLAMGLSGLCAVHCVAT